ncbi:hypothetical protein [Candidatus Uabimicrobium amorphum]|uniref:Uncharacterized protein n=1 Tax=Uabimicrobium amorphum TaxID=2596890 RepID=A0A5S9F245_UABAM|nr:hypothetical protein [Candidatus Uabimicrobium amorphum]BBM82861.1 hypothetical protein UABAM_01204 [Candidatus Uabimicrobium amorphum]
MFSQVVKKALITLSVLFILTSVSFAKLVEKGDKIVFNKNQFSKKNLIEIKWSQGFGTKYKEKYYKVSATCKGKGDLMLFVHKDYKDRLMSFAKLDKKKKKVTATVTNAFRYGQNRKKTRRFLVYHDRSFQPYQHRFLHAYVISMAKKCAKLMKKGSDSSAAKIAFGIVEKQLGKGVVDLIKKGIRSGAAEKAIDVAASTFGDNLRAYSGGLVESGDKIQFKEKDLSSRNLISVEWSQDWGKKYREQYYKISAACRGKRDVVLFVYRDYKDKLLSSAKISKKGEVTIRVNRDFRYGQDRKRTKRFLVYHDAKFKPFQHRFVSAYMIMAANKCVRLAKTNKMLLNKAYDLIENEVGESQVDAMKKIVAGGAMEKLIKAASSVVGDDLRSY